MKADRFGQFFGVPLREKKKHHISKEDERLESLREADTVLRHVLDDTAADKVKYPHNFTFRAMERICMEQERRQHRVHIIGYVAATLISACAIVLFVLTFDFSNFFLPDFSVYGTIFSNGLFSGDSSITFMMAFCFVFFVVLNRILSRYFYGKN